MIGLTVNVDVSQAIAKFQRMEKSTQGEREVTTQRLANLGKAFAAAVAPRNTGATVQGIVVRKGASTLRQIRATNMHPHPMSTGGTFNLPYWMHNSPKARTHIKTGDPHFMFTTRDYLSGLAGIEARKLVARVTKK